jgi:hypothetical protein
MLIIKMGDSEVEITVVVTDLQGQPTTPIDQPTITVYPNGSDVRLVDSAAMVEKDSETGYYKYMLDVSGVRYQLFNILVKYNLGGTTYKITDSIPVIDPIALISAGAIPVPYHLVDEYSGTPKPGIVTWLSTDAAGNTIYTPRVRTNSGGIITWYLPAGVTFYLWTDQSTDYISSIVAAVDGTYVITNRS